MLVQRRTARAALLCASGACVIAATGAHQQALDQALNVPWRCCSRKGRTVGAADSRLAGPAWRSGSWRFMGRLSRGASLLLAGRTTGPRAPDHSLGQLSAARSEGWWDLGPEARPEEVPGQAREQVSVRPALRVGLADAIPLDSARGWGLPRKLSRQPGTGGAPPPRARSGCSVGVAEGVRLEQGASAAHAGAKAGVWRGVWSSVGLCSSTRLTSESAAAHRADGFRSVCQRARRRPMSNPGSSPAARVLLCCAARDDFLCARRREAAATRSTSLHNTTD